MSFESFLDLEEKYEFLDFWIRWRYFENEKSYRSSAGAKMVGIMRAFQIVNVSACISRPERFKGTKDEVQRPKEPPA